MIPQIAQIKKNHPNAVVLVKFNEVYWAYDADADILHTVLGSRVFDYPSYRCAVVNSETYADRQLKEKGYSCVVYDSGEVRSPYQFDYNKRYHRTSYKKTYNKPSRNSRTNKPDRTNSWLDDAFVPKARSSYRSRKEVEAEIEQQRQAEEAYQRRRAVEKVSKTSVGLYSRVTVKINDEKETYRIVKPGEEKPFDNWISYESPIGAALIGHQAGNKVTAHTPSGDISIYILALNNKNRRR